MLRNVSTIKFWFLKNCNLRYFCWINRDPLFINFPRNFFTFFSEEACPSKPRELKPWNKNWIQILQTSVYGSIPFFSILYSSNFPDRNYRIMSKVSPTRWIKFFLPSVNRFWFNKKKWFSLLFVSIFLVFVGYNDMY